MARGPRKPRFNQGVRKKSHNDSNTKSVKKKMLNTRKAKMFRLDLEDLLATLEIGENHGVIAANISTKMLTGSFNDAVDYLNRAGEKNNLSERQIGDIKRLMDRYSIWR